MLEELEMNIHNRFLKTQFHICATSCLIKVYVKISFDIHFCIRMSFELNLSTTLDVPSVQSSQHQEHNYI